MRELVNLDKVGGNASKENIIELITINQTSALPRTLWGTL